MNKLQVRHKSLGQSTGHATLPVETPAFEGGELFHEPLEREAVYRKLKEILLAVVMLVATVAWMGS